MKTIFLTILICTPIGWMWNWWHYYFGVNPAWFFPTGQVYGISFLGIPIEDWAFYPITGGFFVTMWHFDPLKKIIKNRRSTDLLKNVFFIFLVYFSFAGFLIFGESGSITALCFGAPSILLYIAIYRYWNIWHFIRILIVVVPTNVIWDYWATPYQWCYPVSTGVFSEKFWWADIPFEMTPYLGIMAAYFVFAVATFIRWRITHE